MKSIRNFFLAGVTTALSVFNATPVLADYEPVREVSLRNFVNASEKAGLIYGGYEKFSYCLSTPETIDGRVPVAIICPKIGGERGSEYATRVSDNVRAVFISILVTTSSNKDSMKSALRRVANVSQAFVAVRYDVTTDSMGNVMATEMDSTIDGDNTDDWVNDNGNECSSRTRNLTAVGTFETTACLLNQETMRITFWF